jgi:starvation-inducible outer membrane lipoprotein
MQEFAMKVNRGVLVLAALAVAACAPAFSPEALDRVDRAVTFRQLQANPDAYLGKWVLAGGIILETRNAPEGTTLEVLERPVDCREDRARLMTRRAASSSNRTSFLIPPISILENAFH